MGLTAITPRSGCVGSLRVADGVAGDGEGAGSCWCLLFVDLEEAW